MSKRNPLEPSPRPGCLRRPIQGVRGSRPLLGFLFETPVCLVDEFREGNVSPGAGQLEFYRQGRTRMPVGKRLAWHNPRGQAENFHKALKHGLGLEQLPCGDSEANAVFFRIGVLAYNLFIGVKRLACPAAWAAQTITTVRWRLVQVAGRILRHAGRVVLRLVLEAEALACWHTIRQRCWALGVAT